MFQIHLKLLGAIFISAENNRASRARLLLIPYQPLVPLSTTLWNTMMHISNGRLRIRHVCKTITICHEQTTELHISMKTEMNITEQLCIELIFLIKWPYCIYNYSQTTNMFYISASIVFPSDCPVKKEQMLCWLDERASTAYISVCVSYCWNDMNELDHLCVCMAEAEQKSKKDKEKSEWAWREWKNERARWQIHSVFLSFPLKKKHIFSSLAFTPF